jgi:lysophospholipase L1-like esterase
MQKCGVRFNLLVVLTGLTVMLSSCGMGALMSVDQLTDADDNTIVNLGDSIFALSGDIYTNLESKSGETWRHYAISGAQMIGGILATPIPDQYADAKADDPNIRMVYMDGGGNDILIPAIALDPYGCKSCNYWWCGSISQSCKDLINDVYVETVDLLNQMGSDGVQKVVFQGYYHLKFGLFGDLTTLDKAVDYGDKMLKLACTNANVNAVFVDPRASFEGKESSYIIADGIHPTAAGSAVLANLLWSAMGM